MRDRDLVKLVHADDSSDDESSSAVREYSLAAHFDDDATINWSKFNFLLGVRCLYQENVSDIYYLQKTELGKSTWPADKLKAWVSASVTMLVENMLYNSVYTVESDALFELFKARHTDVINTAIEKLLENPRALAKQLRSPKKISEVIKKNLRPLRSKLGEFIAGITEAEVAAAGAQPLSFKNISDVAEFRGIIMQQALQFLRTNNLLRADGRVALKPQRLSNVARLRTVNLNLWQKKCFELAQQHDNANTNLELIISNNVQTIVKLWLREAFADLQQSGVVATQDPAVFLIPVNFDFSQGPLAPLFAARPANFNNLFAKAALLRENLTAKLAEDFSVLSAEIFTDLYRKQGMKMQRAAFKPEFKLEGIVGWLASVRLAIRLKRRAQRSAVEAGDGERVHEKHAAVTWYLVADDRQRNYTVSEQQTLTSFANQSDMLPDLGSYKAIAKELQVIIKKFNDAHPSFKISEKIIAPAIFGILKNNKFTRLKRGDGVIFDLAASDDFSAVALKRFITALSCLLFVTEVQRHPAALVMHVLMLDLIKGGKMTFAEAFEGAMPMAMEGAVAVARDIQANHRAASFHPYSYPGSPKTNPEFVSKESALVDKWLGVFAVNATADREKMTAVCERVQEFCAG